MKEIKYLIILILLVSLNACNTKKKVPDHKAGLLNVLDGPVLNKKIKDSLLSSCKEDKNYKFPETDFEATIVSFNNLNLNVNYTGARADYSNVKIRYKNCNTVSKKERTCEAEFYIPNKYDKRVQCGLYGDAAIAVNDTKTYKEYGLDKKALKNTTLVFFKGTENEMKLKIPGI